MMSIDHSLEQIDPVAARRQRVLNIVVQEYTRTAQPVSSNAIVKHYDLGVSAATVRNDLSALEQEGFLTHPHTSAGRIPTVFGYRFFVQHLLADQQLSTSERSLIRTEFDEARREVDQWLRVSTSVLARTSQSAALATSPRAVSSKFKHLELVEIHNTKVLLVLVLQEGTVKQQLLDLDGPIAQDELSKLSNALNAMLRDAGTDDVLQKIASLEIYGPQALPARQVVRSVAEIMERYDHQQSGQIYRDGLTQVLEAPEFSENASARMMISILEERPLIDQIVGDYLNDGDIHVVIAGDGRYDQLAEISLVIGTYGTSNRATGILGVVGPLRMTYGRNISAVRFVAGVMSEMVNEIFGYPPKQSS